MRAAVLIGVASIGLALFVGCPPGQPAPTGPAARAVPLAAPDPVAIHADPDPSALVRIPTCTYRSFFPGKDEPKRQPVGSFRLERHPVTNADFAVFVAANPKWARGSVKALFADESYLFHWPSSDMSQQSPAFVALLRAPVRAEETQILPSIVSAVDGFSQGWKTESQTRREPGLRLKNLARKIFFQLRKIRIFHFASVTAQHPYCLVLVDVILVQYMRTV